MTRGIAQAVEAPGRVQAIDSDLTDLVLHSGKKLALELEGTIQPTPSLKRTIEGASSIGLSVYDSDLRFLRSSLAATDWNAEIDGLWFRYVAFSGTGRPWSLTLEDREVSRIREFSGPLKVYAHRGKPNEVTRAEFVKRLVEEANPHLVFVCPELHVQQPVRKVKDSTSAKGASQESAERREAGIGAAKHLTVKGQPATNAQKELGEMAIRVAGEEQAPFRVQVALIAGLIVESVMGEAAPGNVLEAIGAGGAEVTNAAGEIRNFLTGGGGYGEGAIEYFQAHPAATFYEITQAIQKSGAGAPTKGAANYGPWGDEARAWVETYAGEVGEEGGEGSKSTPKPRTFEVKKGEDYWTAIQRLAKEVNWRAFVVGSRFYFMSEITLAQGMVRLAIDKDTEGIEQLEIDYHRNKPVTEVKFKALAKEWKPPPGAVVTVADYGPASIGFGDPPLARGQKRALSQHNRNAKTGEGRGRYIVTSIEAPLTEASDARRVTVTLKKPTAPLPEPAAETESVSGNPNAPADPAAGENGMGVYAGTAEDVVNEVVFYAQKHGFPDISPQSVREANATHGPTVDGTRSDHQGPPATAWAADISNGYETPEEAALAAAIAKAFGIPWDGAGLVTHEAHGYRLQLIHNTMEGGNHYNHVHFGCEVIG